jgi:4-hydroxy 2-oxovalerate aldolase
MSITLLDCTLRDGSYAIDFQFSAKFTNEFCKALNDLNFEYIEVGHGMGIGASEKVRKALATDFQYGQAAADAKKNSKWGMFAQPAFSEMKDIDELINLGMDFIRVGIDINELSQGISYVEELCSKKIEVFINLMKSYSLPAVDVVSCMKKFISLGVQGVYLVDSAGGMLPNEIYVYGSELQTIAETSRLGFHGHDNLGLAISNSLLLAQMGFTLIDCTMQGMGRSSGNAATEKLLAVFKRSGFENSLDLIKVLKLGNDLIRPKLPSAGHGGLDTLAGYSLFHTSYMENLLSISREIGVDPYSLMQEHCSTNIVTGSMSELRQSATKLFEAGITLDAPLPNDRYVGNEQT